MPRSAASTAAGIAFISASEKDLADGVYACNYGTSGFNWTISVYQAPNTEQLSDLLADLGGESNSKPLNGLGDKAYVSPVGVAVKAGSRLIEVGSADNSAANEAGYKALAAATVAALN